MYGNRTKIKFPSQVLVPTSDHCESVKKFSFRLSEVADADHEQYEDEEDSSSDAEGEWVPSCWDSLAQPSRSALKSPDKSSSVSKFWFY